MDNIEDIINSPFFSEENRKRYKTIQGNSQFELTWFVSRKTHEFTKLYINMGGEIKMDHSSDIKFYESQFLESIRQDVYSLFHSLQEQMLMPLININIIGELRPSRKKEHDFNFVVYDVILNDINYIPPKLIKEWISAYDNFIFCEIFFIGPIIECIKNATKLNEFRRKRDSIIIKPYYNYTLEDNKPLFLEIGPSHQ